MSFDIPPMHIADNSPEAKAIEAILAHENVSPEEVVRRALRSLVVPGSKTKPSHRKPQSKAVEPISDEELANIDRLCPALKLLDQVTDEEWNDVLVGACPDRSS